MTSDLHPADQVHADRIARALGRPGHFCDHGQPPAHCRICIQLRHAEATSIAVRAAYAAGDWPPSRRPRLRGVKLGGLSERIAAGAPST